MLKITLITLTLGLTLTACSSKESFADKVRIQGQQYGEIAEGWEEGESLIQDGTALMESGNEKIEDGNDLVQEGQEDYEEGRAMFQRGQNMKIQSENHYNQTVYQNY